jgi:LacI family transcriptional regulator
MALRCSEPSVLRTMVPSNLPADNLPRTTVNLKQVAALAGVSPSTVSRAIAKPQSLHPDTLKRVQVAIDSLDYVPFAPARVLRSGLTRTIGILAPTILNELYALAVDTLVSEFDRLGYTVLLTCHRGNQEAKMRSMRALIERGIDGLAIIGPNHHHDLFALLRRQKVPYILMWATDREHVHPTVGYDQKLAMMKITDHLAGLGHERFAILPGPLGGHKLSEERLAGAREGLSNFGFALTPRQIGATPYEPDAIRKAARELLGRGVGPTALICGNDMIAASAIAECRSIAVDVPGQVSVTGFGDWEVARLISPTLTTIHSDAVRIGMLTAQGLLAQIAADREQPVRQIEYEPELIIRESTSSPNRSRA